MYMIVINCNCGVFVCFSDIFDAMFPVHRLEAEVIIAQGKGTSLCIINVVHNKLNYLRIKNNF